MGSTSNGYSPYDITFTYVDGEEVSDKFTIGFMDDDGSVVETQEVPVTVFHPKTYRCSDILPVRISCFTDGITRALIF